MTTERHELTSADVWSLIEGGATVAEIAAYAGVCLSAAHAMACRATRLHAWAQAA